MCSIVAPPLVLVQRRCSCRSAASRRSPSHLPPLPAPPARAQLTMTILLALVILIDYMFLTESDFLFDPSVSNFMRKNAPA